MIVPEGIHFVSQNAHKQLRRTLLENGYLLADISLPHGVFKPYASVKTHILIIDRPRATRSNEVLFIEIENDGFTQTDTREPIAGSELRDSLINIESFYESIDNNEDWQPPETAVRSYSIPKASLLATEGVHLLGRWHDLSNRVIHRPDFPLMRLGDICQIRDGMSPNMATPPGDFAMVVPASERKTADHFDFDGDAVCVPLVSSAGHGKADIKRLHYQDGKFALASTMTALFVKDTDIVHPRYLYIFLSAMAQELLVPLMRGATNVTMNSNQLVDVLVPVPSMSLQNDIIEADLIMSTASTLRTAAEVLKDKSTNPKALKLAQVVLDSTNDCISDLRERATIHQLLPSK